MYRFAHGRSQTGSGAGHRDHSPDHLVASSRYHPQPVTTATAHPTVARPEPAPKSGPDAVYSTDSEAADVESIKSVPSDFDLPVPRRFLLPRGATTKSLEAAEAEYKPSQDRMKTEYNGNHAFNDLDGFAGRPDASFHPRRFQPLKLESFDFSHVSNGSYPPTESGFSELNDAHHVPADAGLADNPIVDPDEPPNVTNDKTIDLPFHRGGHEKSSRDVRFAPQNPTKHRVGPKQLGFGIANPSRNYLEDPLQVAGNEAAQLPDRTAPLAQGISGASPKPPQQNPALDMYASQQASRRNRFAIRNSVKQSDTTLSGDEGDGDDAVWTPDYEKDELAQKTFEELRSQDLDHDPNTKEDEIPDSQHGEDLSDRLRWLADEDSHAQIQFFRALTMQQWEESGDWFLHQFQQTISKFAELRKAKRNLTREFEAEVSDRHDQVEAKKQSIEAALGEMRATGQGLLAATPAVKKSQIPQKHTNPPSR